MKDFQESGGFNEVYLASLHQMKARIEILCDPADLKKTDESLKQLSNKIIEKRDHMPEKPIDLFGGLAERYPEADDIDTLQRIGRAGVATIPVLGGTLNELLSTVFTPAVLRRRDEWFKELAQLVDRLKAKVEGFKPEDLAKNEQFISATIQATRIAAGVHQHEKREMLRNALLNIAVGSGPDEELQQIFLNAIESFTASHIGVLKVLWKGANEAIEKHGIKSYDLNKIGTYGNAILFLIPDLKGRDDLVQCIMTDLRNRGFSTATGPEAAFPSDRLITNTGIQFLGFISGDGINE